MTNELKMECDKDEIPEEFRKELFTVLLHYSVTLIGLRGDVGYSLCGSGTLIQSGGQHFVLTAAHCARELAKCDEIGLGIVELFDLPHRFVIPNPPLAIVVPNEGEFGDEWGPDLAFLPLPTDKVGDLKARKSFCNLDACKETMLKTAPDTDHRGYWAFVGTPAATSNLENPRRPHLSLTVHWTLDDIHQQTKSNFDYLDIDVPNLDFRGVSGGGLWRIDLGRYTDGGWAMVGSPALEGCAFYQTKPQGDRRLVRCHGRRSIYQHGLTALRQSQG